MRKVLVTLVVLFAFANIMSSDLDFSDTQAWKQFTSVADYSGYITKIKDVIYINYYRYNIVSGTRTFVYSKSNAIVKVDIDKFGNAWVIADSSLVRQGATDTAVYTAAKNGFPGGWIRTIYCDKANGRVIVGTDQGIGISNVDAKGEPTGWVNALSVSIHQIVVVSGKVFAINNAKVYWLNSSGTWDNYDGLGYPHYSDVDREGNLWVTFARPIAGTFEYGLAMYDGQEWKEYLVSTDLATSFGKIVIDKNNTLWFSCKDNGIGSIDLSTVIVSALVPEGTYSWAPKGQQVAISKDENGLVIFSGAGGGVYAIAPTAVRSPLLVRDFSRGDYKVFGTFDLNGRKIVTKSFSSVVHLSGMRIVAVQTSRKFVVEKTITIR